MYYIFGDIHGHCSKLVNLFAQIEPLLKESDKLIFLGDYIDRGDDSYEVVEYLISLQKRYTVIALMGNHEKAFSDFLDNNDIHDVFISNGGNKTIQSYKKHAGGVFSLPAHHKEFYTNLRYYYETKEFIAVHAGLNPKINTIEDQKQFDLLWIRDAFYRSHKKWKKTVIFGHTPTMIFRTENQVYIDDAKNIIGVDSGVIAGNSLSCIRLPDRTIFNSVR